MNLFLSTRKLTNSGEDHLTEFFAAALQMSEALRDAYSGIARLTSLLNPDLRRGLDRPDQWILLLQFRGECKWLSRAGFPEDHFLDPPTFGDSDFLQYFVREEDFHAGRLDRSVLGYMLM